MPTKVIIAEHDKIVRDNIVDIIQRDRSTIEVKSKTIRNKEELKPLMLDKLAEEAGELKTAYHSNKEIVLEELADVLEVIDKIKQLFNVDEKELQQIRNEKASAKGKFNKGIYLEYVKSRKEV